MKSSTREHYQVDLIDGFLHKSKHFFIFERDPCKLKQIIDGYGQKHPTLKFCIYTLKAVAMVIKEIHENSIQHKDICSTNMFIDPER